GFEPDGSQLEECIERFRDRYLDARQMKLESLQMARELPALKDINENASLERFLNGVRSIRANLVGTVNKSDNSHYMNVVREIMQKMPTFANNLFFMHYNMKLALFDEVDSFPIEKKPDPNSAMSLLDGLIEYLRIREAAARTRQFVMGLAGRDKSTKRSSE